MLSSRLILLPLMLLLLPCVAPAQDYCDPGLRTDRGDPNGYHQRGDRCEGQFVQGDSGNPNLMVASFTKAFGGYNAATLKPLVVEWTPPAGAGLRLRAYSLKPSLFYRMDSIRLAGQTSYTWPVNVLAALGVTKGNVGVVGWTQQNIGGRARDVYVPLRVAQQGGGQGAAGYELIIVPGANLKSLTMSLSLIGPDGAELEVLQTDKRVGGSAYAANVGFKVPLPALRKAGIYLLSLSARLLAGGSATTEIRFYHDN